MQLQSENTNVLIIKLYKTIENKISLIIQCVYILGGPTNNILQISLSRIASARSLKCHLWRALLLSFLHLRSIPLIYIFVHAMTWGAIKKSYNYLKWTAFLPESFHLKYINTNTRCKIISVEITLTEITYVRFWWDWERFICGLFSWVN